LPPPLNKSPIQASGAYLLTLQTTDGTGVSRTGVFRFRIETSAVQSTEQEPAASAEVLSPEDYAMISSQDESQPEAPQDAGAPATTANEVSDEGAAAKKSLDGRSRFHGPFGAFRRGVRAVLQTAATGYDFLYRNTQRVADQRPVAFQFPKAPAELVVTRTRRTTLTITRRRNRRGRRLLMTFGQND
jgi:hypothetical protein